MSVDFDKELSIIGYKIEIRMFIYIYKKLSIDRIIENYKNDINQYIKDSFKYRFLVGNIVSIISTWEQQLYDYISKYYNNTIQNEFRVLKDVYINTLQIPKDEFDKILEFRHLENVLKHGNGTSYDNLVNMSSKFMDRNPDFVSLQNGVSFNILVLNINETTISELCNALESFWDNVKNITVL